MAKIILTTHNERSCPLLFIAALYSRVSANTFPKDILDDSLLQPPLAQKRFRVAAVIIDFFINTIVTTIISLPFGAETYFLQNGDSFSTGYSLTGLPTLLSILI